jgi:hypothetical protein
VIVHQPAAAGARLRLAEIGVWLPVGAQGEAAPQPPCRFVVVHLALALVAQLVKRCAMISGQCELMEKEAISGQPLNAIAYGTLTGYLTRTLSALGLKREPIDVTPALHEYLDTLQAPDELPDPTAAAEPTEPPDSAAATDEKG